MQWSRNLYWCTLLLAVSLSAQQADTLSLAVADLTAQGVRDGEAELVSELLRAEIQKSPGVRLIERTEMQQILDRQGFPRATCRSDSCMIAAGRLLGVRKMVVGSLRAAGGGMVIALRVLDVGGVGAVVRDSVRTEGGIDKVLGTGIAAAAGKVDKALFPGRVAGSIGAEGGGAKEPDTATAAAGGSLDKDSTSSGGPQPEPAKAAHTTLNKAPFIVGGVAVALLVGGGVVAALLLNSEGDSEEPESTPDNTPTPNNTRIDLP